MHKSRLYALVGVGIAITGLFLKSLTTPGEGLLPTLSQTAGGFPDGIPTIWGSLAPWAQVLLVILMSTIVVTALWPIHDHPMDRTSGGIVAVTGLAMLGYAVVQWADATSKADALEAGFTQAVQADIINASYHVNIASGFVILFVGIALVIFGGIISMRERVASLV